MSWMTQVPIIGDGPTGLLRCHFLRAKDINCVVLERQSPEYVLARIRAGVLERTTINLLDRLGIKECLHSDGLKESGFSLSDGERLIRIDTFALTDKYITVHHDVRRR